MLQGKKVLVVEDDQNVVEVIKATLELESVAVEVAHDGDAGLQKARAGQYDLILLDIMLPQQDGFEVCRQLRSEGCGVPIIMLTAKVEEVDKVLGLELGADDYVTKPFSPRELTARCKAAMRRFDRSSTTQAGPELQYGTLRIYPQQYKAQLGDVDLELTPKEFEVFALLAKHPGQTFTRDQILDQVWGFEFTSETRTVDEHVKRIRRKLKEVNCSHVGIKTIWGVGYQFEVKP